MFYLHFREHGTHLMLEMKQSHMEAGRINQITSTLCVHGMYFKQRMHKSNSVNLHFEHCKSNMRHRMHEGCMCVCVHVRARTRTHTRTHHTLRIYNEWKLETLSTSFRWDFVTTAKPKTNTSSTACILSESEYKTYRPHKSFPRPGVFNAWPAEPFAVARRHLYFPSCVNHRCD
jgi:hypothetical protein